jgi:nucleotide-binding universal stress UspA family protein
MYKKILIAYDGSEGAGRAIKSAIELGHALQAEVTAIWVGGFRPYYHETVGEIEEENRAIDQFSSRIRKELKAISKENNLEITFVHLQGNPAKLIVEYAEENHVDLIVMGCKGHSGLWGNDLGHVTDKVSENARCNVLIVRK